MEDKDEEGKKQRKDEEDKRERERDEGTSRDMYLNDSISDELRGILHRLLAHKSKMSRASKSYTPTPRQTRRITTSKKALEGICWQPARALSASNVLLKSERLDSRTPHERERFK